MLRLNAFLIAFSLFFASVSYANWSVRVFVTGFEGISRRMWALSDHTEVHAPFAEE